MEVKFPALSQESMIDRPTNQPTDDATDRVIGKFHLQQLRVKFLALSGKYDGQTDQPTDRRRRRDGPGHREVQLTTMERQRNGTKESTGSKNQLYIVPVLRDKIQLLYCQINKGYLPLLCYNIQLTETDVQGLPKYMCLSLSARNERK